MRKHVEKGHQWKLTPSLPAGNMKERVKMNLKGKSVI